jgi:sensor domain CHASE-containing protein
MENTVFTWTQWDPAYRFMEDHNAQFLAENVSSTLYTGMRIDFCVFIDPLGKVAYAGGYDAATGKDVAVPPALLSAVADPAARMLANTDPTRSVRGISMVGPDPMLVIAAPVTNTAGTAPARGHVVFARRLDAAEIGKISETTHLKCAVTPSTTRIGSIEVQVRDESVIQGLTDVNDLRGAPALRLTVDIPREIDRQARQTLRLLLSAILVIGILFGVVVYVVITRWVLRRVLLLSSQVSEVTETLDFSKRVQVTGDDEISALGRSVNGMICAVSEVLSIHGQDR